MKKILYVFAVAAAIAAVDMQAQPKSRQAAKAAVEKAEAATVNPKQNVKPATWIKYGKTLMDAYSFSKGNVWVGMSRQELSLLGGMEKPVSEETVQLNGNTYTKVVYSHKNYYFSPEGQLAIIEVTAPVVENALDGAVDAYAKAAQLDAKGQKTKEITTALKNIAEEYSEDAFASYSLGNMGQASVYFEKAAKVSATAPLSVVDTNAVYNAAYTAWSANDLARAEKLFLDGVKVGVYGTDGDSYAKLADIADKNGNQEASKKYLEEGFSKFPQSQAILVGLINYYIKSGDDTNRLFELLDEAKKNEPTNASLYYVEGNIDEQLGRLDEAVVAYRKCAEVDPNYEWGYIGEGIHFYNLAVDLQEKASNEMDDAKYMAIMGEFETALKSCIGPFEKAFELSNDDVVKASVAEYLKNACYRFISEGGEYSAKYDKYSAFVAQ